jgi:hypothetical protein
MKPQPNEIRDPEMKAIAAEFPEFAMIIGGANYEAAGLEVIDPDPGMRYYWAAKDDPSRSDGVERVKQLGYRISEKKHNSPDCQLMETPRALYEKRMRDMAAQVRARTQGVRRQIERGDAKLEPIDRSGETGFKKLQGE